jgi:TrmH family RNA methyltransferase
MMGNQDEWRGAVEAVRRATTARGRAAGGYFSIEGIRLHERAVRAGWQVEKAVLARSFYENNSPRVQALIKELANNGCRFFPVADEVAAELTDGRDLGAIIGLLRMPEPPLLRDVVAADLNKSPLLLVAADIKEPGNSGALMRTALAGGASAFVACGISDPYHPKALRTSMGSLFKLPVLTYSSTKALMPDLAALGMFSMGLIVDGDVPLPIVDFPEGGVALFVGSESWGLADHVKQGLDCLVTIPMREGVDSYSVNAAAAIALYEIGRRQGFGQKGTGSGK